MYSDRDLVNKILGGDQRAFTALVKRYEKLVWHIVLKLTNNPDVVADISQEIFIRIFQKLGDFGFRAKLSTWIATVAYRTTINELKKNSLKNIGETVDVQEWKAYFINTSNPENITTQNELIQMIRQAIDRLPRQYKIVLVLYHMEDFNYHEIGEITGMPQGTVKNYLFRGRKMLKELLKKKLKTEVFPEFNGMN
jgi:RNA polymerase sigma-70 factor (ECF subfamily)